MKTKKVPLPVKCQNERISWWGYNSVKTTKSVFSAYKRHVAYKSPISVMASYNISRIGANELSETSRMLGIAYPDWLLNQSQ